VVVPHVHPPNKGIKGFTVCNPVTHPHMSKMAVIVKNDLRPRGKERKLAGWLERGGTGGGEG